jgi:Asp/Glu/hydantoin racemase
MMKYKVAVVHTTAISIDDFKAQFAAQMPEVEMINIIDDSIVSEIVEAVTATPFIIARLSQYYRFCEEMGCGCILNQCTSVKDAVETAAKLVSIPVFHVDYPMAVRAAILGKRIGVVATAISTLETSKRTFENAAKEQNRADAKITVYYCDGAHDFLFKKGDKRLHDKIVEETARKAAAENDVIALAQCSMAPLANNIAHLNVPILTSIESGVAQIKEYLEHC